MRRQKERKRISREGEERRRRREGGNGRGEGEGKGKAEKERKERRKRKREENKREDERISRKEGAQQKVTGETTQRYILTEGTCGGSSERRSALDVAPASWRQSVRGGVWPQGGV